MMRPFFYGYVFDRLRTFWSFGLQLCAFRLRAEARYENIVAPDCNIHDDGSLALHYKRGFGVLYPPPLSANLVSGRLISIGRTPLVVLHFIGDQVDNLSD